MKRLLAIGLLLVPMHGHATCVSDAADKKLSGDARQSFVIQCEMAAQRACSDDALRDKSHTFAEKSRISAKCVQDKVGNVD